MPKGINGTNLSELIFAVQKCKNGFLGDKKRLPLRNDRFFKPIRPLIQIRITHKISCMLKSVIRQKDNYIIKIMKV